MLYIIQEHLTKVNLQHAHSVPAKVCWHHLLHTWDGTTNRSKEPLQSPLTLQYPNIFITAFKKEAISTSQLQPQHWQRHICDIFALQHH
jgi:hypothetical protein